MATNNFKPFATGVGANVTSQADYEALTALVTGFQSGKAASAQINKALRQSSFVSSALAQFISDKLNQDVLDNGDISGFNTKLIQAFAMQYLSRSNPFSDIKADGTVSTALANLGLGDGTALPVGTPIPWPASTPPTGWITLSGQTITSAQYPKLFALYGSKLPDLRGQFIRGWANDGSVDAGRALLSSQGDAIRNITGSATPTAGPGLSYLQTTGFAGALTAASVTAIQPLTGFGASTPSQFTGIFFDASRSVPTASENRPVNIAFNYIVRGI